MEKTTCNPNICQFIEYIATPGEKHSGLAKVLMYNKLIVLFKWMPTKDGVNHFVSAPSFKIGDRYESAVYIDSRSESEAIERYIRYCIMDIVNSKSTGSKVQMNGSALQAKSDQEELSF